MVVQTGAPVVEDAPDLTALGADRLRAGRPRWRAAVVALGLGLAVGGLAGLAAGAARPTEVGATTVLSVLPDTSVASSALGSGADRAAQQDATAFIQSELIVLNGRPLRDQVRRQLQLGGLPDVTSSQVGQTYVVVVTATARDQAQALAVSSTTAQVYTDSRRTTLDDALQRALDSVTEQVTQVQRGLSGGGSAAGQVPVLQAEYQRLLAVESSLRLSRAQVGRAVTTLQPPTPVGASALTPLLRDALAGAALGALLALLVLLAVRRLSPRLHGLEELTALGVPVIVPEMERLPAADDAALQAALHTPATRLVASRLSLATDTSTAALVLVGVGPGVGAGDVAVGVCAALAELRSVVLVLAADAVRPGRARQVLGVAQDAPSLDVLRGRGVSPATVAACCAGTAIPGLSVLAPGPSTTARDISALVQAGLLEAAREAAGTRGTGPGVVVVDAPLLADSGLTAQLAARAGGAALVVDRDRSLVTDILAAADILAANEARLIGAVLVHRRRRRARRAVSPSAPASSGQPTATRGLPPRTTTVRGSAPERLEGSALSAPSRE